MQGIQASLPPRQTYLTEPSGKCYTRTEDLTQLKKAPNYSWLKEATATTLQQSLKVVARVKEKIANTRQDLLHKISRKLVDKNQIIVVESLGVKRLARTKLAKSVPDVERL